MLNVNVTEPTPPAKLSRRAAAAAAAMAPVDYGLTVSVHVDFAVLEHEWRALEADNAVSLHQSYDWCRCWAKAHPHQVVVLRGAIGGRTVMLLPLEIVQGALFRTARFIGSPHSNLNTGLFAADLGLQTPQDLAQAILDQLSVKLGRIADIVTLEKIALEWRGHQHPLSPLPSVRNQNASFQLPLTGDFEQTLAQINAKRRRKKFRVSEKRLEALGGYTHIVARTGEDRQILLDTFLAQKAARFKALGLPNVFADVATTSFLKALANVPPIDGNQPLTLHAIRLTGENDGRIVAIAGISRKGDHIICQFGSIDDGLAGEASPGELLFFLMIRDAVADGVRLFDFGIGDQPYKRSWCTQTTVLHDIILPLTLRGRLGAGWHRLMVLTKSAIKANQTVYGLIQRLRQRRQGPTATGDGAA